MRGPSIRNHPVTTLLLAATLSIAFAALANAQSQEAKPAIPGTPATRPEPRPSGTPVTGLHDTSWQGPNWGVAVSWDPLVWTVEGELIDEGYDGLQIGTPTSTVYIEAYDGFAGDAGACLDNARREMDDREGIVDVTPLPDRPLPGPEDARGSAGLFGITAKLADGTPYHGVEYVECRALAPGAAVLELTWQTATTEFEAELPAVTDLFAALAVPGDDNPPEIPGAPVPPASI